jgi:hypothetical protein
MRMHRICILGDREGIHLVCAAGSRLSTLMLLKLESGDSSRDKVDKGEGVGRSKRSLEPRDDILLAEVGVTMSRQEWGFQNPGISKVTIKRKSRGGWAITEASNEGIRR